MDSAKKYRCVNCGEPAGALYKTYGPSVLKLTKCEKCRNVVDKYVEYDPVIVMIDLVLMSREAQRHVLYNTEFQSYWKLFIVLVMLETYGVWRSDSLFNIAIDAMCGVQNNSTNLTIPVSIPIPESWKSKCWAWVQEEKGDDSDVFIWEKDFYIQFISTFSGIVVFMLIVNSLMRILKSNSGQKTVSWGAAWRGLSLARASVVLSLPALVWGGDCAPHTRALHYALVLAYSFVMHTGVFTVLYETSLPATVLTLLLSYSAKYVTSFHMTPLLRQLIS